MTRRYSHCNGNGQSSRSGGGGSGGSGGGGPRLFGVRLTDGSFIKKSASMGSLSHQLSPTGSPDGYHSDDIEDGFTVRRPPLRRRGVSWTEPEHRQFLLGLERYGRGNWRAISRNYVPSRTPAQVASHAQKYFIRQSNTNEPGRRRRASLFDLATDMETDPPQQESSGVAVGGSNGPDANNLLPSLDLSLRPAFTPSMFQLWPPNAYSVNDHGEGTSQQQIDMPVPVVPKAPMEELVGMSQLKLG
ncbi:hypothetical protein ACS0TY_036039 [Phlomoides rotata]